MSSSSGLRCPTCSIDTLEEIYDCQDFDALPVYMCSTCNDLMDVSILCELLDWNNSQSDTDDVHIDVRIKVMKCDNCGNEENDLIEVLDIIPDDDAGEAVMHMNVICLACEHPQTILVVTCDSVDDESTMSLADAHHSEDQDDGYSRDWSEVLHEERTAECRLESSRHTEGFDECWSCGKTRADGLMEEKYDGDGRLIFLHCHVCDIDLQLSERSFQRKVLSEQIGYSYFTPGVQYSFCSSHDAASVRCVHCGNSDIRYVSEQYDTDGNLIYRECLVCENVFDLPVTASAGSRLRPHHRGAYKGVENAKYGNNQGESMSIPRRERVTDFSKLRRGDHIALHKPYIVWHHAIVGTIFPQNRSRGRIEVIHNSGEAKQVLNGYGPNVREETIDADLSKDELYRYDYSMVAGSNRYSPDEVIRRARSRLGEKYNPLTFNCEHFARWCMTGKEKSEQVGTFCERLGTVAGCVGAKVIHEGIATGVEFATNAAHSFPKYMGCIKQRAVTVFEGATKAARFTKVGAIVGNVVVNVIAEGIQFGVDAWKSFQKYRSGLIGKDDFRQQLSKAGVESVGGLIGSTAGGIIGQLLIPIPFVGSFIGCTLGGLLFRFCGAMLGKLIGKR